MDETAFAVIVVIIEDTSEAVERLAKAVEQIDGVDEGLTWEAAEELQAEVSQFGRFGR
jgi:translation elongation factor EF-1beta